MIFNFILLVGLITIVIQTYTLELSTINHIQQTIKQRYSINDDHQLNLIHTTNFKLNNVNITNLFFKLNKPNKYLIIELVGHHYQITELTSQMFDSYIKSPLQTQFFITGHPIIPNLNIIRSKAISSKPTISRNSPVFKYLAIQNQSNRYQYIDSGLSIKPGKKEYQNSMIQQTANMRARLELISMLVSEHNNHTDTVFQNISDNDDHNSLQYKQPIEVQDGQNVQQIEQFLNQRSILVLFDGVCVLCDRAMNTFHRFDKYHRLKFYQLQDLDESFCKEYGVKQDLKSMYVVYRDDENQNWTLFYSDSVLYTMSQLGFPLNMLGRAGLLVPKSIRDFFYRQVAKQRYNIFGKKELQ